MIENAIKIADRSSTGKYAMGCVIATFDNKVLSNGWAHIPEMKNWRLYSLHAELHALARARNISFNFAHAIAYIAAVSRKSRNTTIARPCRDCVVALFSAGIRKLVYTVPGTQDHICFETEYLHDLNDIDSFKIYNSPQW